MGLPFDAGDALMTTANQKQIVTKTFSPRITLFDPSTLAQIHDRSAAILENVGVKLPHDGVRRMLVEKGAHVEAGGQIVKIPRRLIEQAVKESTKTYRLYNARGEPTAHFGLGKRNYNSIAGEASWFDGRTRRASSLSDVITAAHIAEQLDQLNITGAMADPHELPPQVRCIHVAATLLKYTRKPFTFWYYDGPSAAYINELLIAAAGSLEQAKAKPRTYAFLEPISPLSFPRDGLDVVYQTRDLNLPVSIGPMAQAGATAPVTLAGTIVQENAEILAGICVTQLVQPGAAICYGGIPHAFGMRSTQMVFAGPEQALMAVGLTQMGKFYGLPVYINVGLTDSKVADAQAGLEIASTLIFGALAGADIFGHFGVCGVDQATSLDILLLQHEIACYVERLLQGIDIDDERYACDLIEQVGPGGNFLAEDHTAAHYRSQMWFPSLLDRNFFEIWDQQGRKETSDRIAERKNELLAKPAEVVIDPTTAKELDKILASAERSLLERP
jgi:trimethylamine--corrinoid protein Co-methyltransferase